MKMRRSKREEAWAKEEVWEMMLLGGPGTGMVAGGEEEMEDEDDGCSGGVSSRRR